jgi:DNA topoisomerase-2
LSTTTSERYVSHCFFVTRSVELTSLPKSIFLQRHLVSELELVHDRLSNQARFIKCIIDGEITLSKRKRTDIVAELRKKDFRPFPKVAKALVAAAVDENGQEEEDADAEAGADSDYDYLLSMSLSSLTAEKVSLLPLHPY